MMTTATTEGTATMPDQSDEQQKKADANKRRSEAMRASWARRRNAMKEAASKSSVPAPAPHLPKRKSSKPKANSQAIQAKVKAASMLLGLCNGDHEAAKVCVEMVHRMSDMS